MLAPNLGEGCVGVAVFVGSNNGIFLRCAADNGSRVVHGHVRKGLVILIRSCRSNESQRGQVVLLALARVAPLVHMRTRKGVAELQHRGVINGVVIR